MTTRIHTLDRLSEIIIDGVVTRKLDFLGTVFIHGRHYFNVFRRYNSAYEIVLEDLLGDFHFHRNYTVRESVQRILCYTDEAIRELYSHDVVAFKNQAPVYEQVVDMRWSEIQGRYAGAAIRLVGVPNEWYVKEEPVWTDAATVDTVPPLESQLDWGETQTPSQSPSPTSSGHRSAPYAPRKEEGEAWHQWNTTPSNLSSRFWAVSEASSVNEVVDNRASPRSSMENFPDFKILRNGKKIRNNRQ